MFTGGYGRGDAIPSGPPPLDAAKLITPLRNTPPELPASTAELNSNNNTTGNKPVGFFLRAGLFPWRWGAKKKRQKKVCAQKVFCYLTHVRIDSNNNNNNNQIP